MAASSRLRAALERRFGIDMAAEIASFLAQGDNAGLSAMTQFAARGSCRDFAERELPLDVVRLLAATALSAPSKSDLQQADIVIVNDPSQRAALAALVPTMPWVATAPAFLVFCGNNRRIRQIAERRGHAFANDHLDAFFNATVDAAIVLASFIQQAEAAGLGCCPVSVLRNQSQKVSDLLALPEHVFVVAGLALGWPRRAPEISPRLGLAATLHLDRFREDANDIDTYDRRRQAVQPFARQRRPDLFGEVAEYGWSEDKSRQYALPERTDFGAFVRGKGFKTD